MKKYLAKKKLASRAQAKVMSEAKLRDYEIKRTIVEYSYVCAKSAKDAIRVRDEEGATPVNIEVKSEIVKRVK